ncbi:uncharacterized mitochondrial protein AtMg00810-like [Rutidosis leptorrhynchoides]|uniref:uncharacterized mitochondrial protein AtMg00810-like n=1 Tax=Rutidosis leptorrhynchoides TaxID=125765 RepID=UPI003A9A271D
MSEEYNALIKNGTWTLVPHPLDMNIVRSMWLFKHKFTADGILSRYRLVSLLTVIASKLVLSVMRLSVQLSSRLLFRRLLAFVTLLTESCLPATDIAVWVKACSSGLVSAVSRVCSASSSTIFLQRVIDLFYREFSMTDLGPLNYFLGMFVARTSSRMFLSQKKYATGIIECADIVVCNSSHTPINTSTKLMMAGPPVTDPSLYRSLIEPHMAALRRILCYVQGTLDLGLQLFASSTTSLVAYSDDD